jgi:hypothetical protein
MFLLTALCTVALGGLAIAPAALATDPYGYPPPCSGYTCPPTQVCDEFVGTVCVNPGPVEGAYDPNQAGPTMVTGPFTAAEVIVFPHSIPVPGTVRLDENPPDPGTLGLPSGGKSQTFSVLSAWFDVTFTATQGVFDPAGPWDPPMQVIFPLPASASTLKASAIAVFSHATAWRRIPDIGTATTLDATQLDGYYLTGSGASRFVHVLTRHLTVFAAFKVTVVKPPKPKPTLVTFSTQRPCGRHAAVRVRVHQPTGTTIVRATVRATGRRARVVRGAALRRVIRVRHLPRGRFTVRVTLRKADGSTVSARRSYRACRA